MKFLHKALPVIYGKPDYQSIHNMWNILYGNASTINNTLGGGNNGHIEIVMQYTIYTTISPTSYSLPVELGGIEPPPPYKKLNHNTFNSKTNTLNTIGYTATTTIWTRPSKKWFSMW